MRYDTSNPVGGGRVDSQSIPSSQSQLKNPKCKVQDLVNSSPKSMPTPAIIFDSDEPNSENKCEENINSVFEYKENESKSEHLLNYRDPQLSSSDEEDDSSGAEGDEDSDDLISKGPDRCNKSQDLRRSAGPYTTPNQNVFNHPNHLCGGRIVQNRSSQHNIVDNAQTEKSDDPLVEDINKFLNEWTPQEQVNFICNFDQIMALGNFDVNKLGPDRVAQPLNQEVVHSTPPLMPNVHLHPSVNKGSGISQTSIPQVIPVILQDDDSDYGSMSPQSSINSPRPLSAFSANSPSPIPDSWMPTGFLLDEGLRRGAFNGPRPIVPDTLIIQEGQMSSSAEERITNGLNKKQLTIEWIRTLQDDTFFTLPTLKDDTKLLKHLKNPNKFFYEVLHCFLERIKQHDDKKQSLEYLKCNNGLGESALRFALFHMKDRPLVARYIVEILVFLGDDVDQMHLNGRPLLHLLIEKGDLMAETVAELLNAKKADGKVVFDVNKKNNLLETPLHIAAKLHGTNNISTLTLAKLLINHNASILMQDSNGMTPVHLAVKYSCDRLLIKALLSNAMSLSAGSSIKDHIGDTAMHLAASRNDLPPMHQAQVMRQLRLSNWNLREKNNLDKTPLSLLIDDRRQEVLKIINLK